METVIETINWINSANEKHFLVTLHGDTIKYTCFNFDSLFRMLSLFLLLNMKFTHLLVAERYRLNGGDPFSVVCL